ncbi:hypothetical protein PPERSA_08968 [Pseudocohnilembus persalinus]|uniref:VWFA domain-containing protein n=1 Tax=Pseudocohnilembus persalinus TaxID=266149 RepID=A0A0V0R3F2_PSEPJ|nr:hypothetical protein PPERSA_08968 [Pseudocohnilembus persalinus]|eukprot:KRX08864.1 hypothetical protein PPERSA_08968 [Pseudocohnilembus persalinus]
MDQLIEESNCIMNNDLQINLEKSYEFTYEEINCLTKKFQEVNVVIQFSTDEYFQGTDAEQLVKYSVALQFFKQTNNTQAQGICYNNMGAIHLKHNKINEAVDNFRKSVNLIEDALLQEVKCQNIHLFYKVRPINDGLLDKKKSREIKAYLYLCEAYQERFEYLEKKAKEEEEEDYNLEDALIKLNQGEDKLLQYEKIYKLFLEDDKLDDPPTILQQQILLQKGLFHKKFGNYKLACQYFKECIEFGSIQAKDIRNKCLLQLQEIFTKQGLIDKAPHIPKMIKENQSKPDKDVVFLLDQSESMGKTFRQKYALSTLLNIFDNYIGPQDRLAYVKFNQNVQVIYELNETKRNLTYMRDQIYYTKDIKPSGETALYLALLESFKLFKKVPEKNHRKWIICLTDGDDTCSTVSQKKVRRLLKSEEIGLIIVGIALNQAQTESLTELCVKTHDGAFIQSVESNDLHIALQSISNLVHANTQMAEGCIVESFY